MSRSSNLPMVLPNCGPRSHQRVFEGRPAAGAFDAQMLGQDGARRGLKGGAPVLDAARGAYLEAEWSGDADRRLPSGLIRHARI